MHINQEVRTTSPLYVIRGRPQSRGCMSWLFLIFAGLFEAAWLLLFSKSHAFSHKPFALLAILAMGISVYLFGLSTKTLPIAVAYLVWLSIGALSIVMIESIYFGKVLTLAQLTCLCLIFIGVAGLKFSQ